MWGLIEDFSLPKLTTSKACLEILLDYTWCPFSVFCMLDGADTCWNFMVSGGIPISALNYKICIGHVLTDFSQDGKEGPSFSLHRLRHLS